MWHLLGTGELPHFTSFSLYLSLLFYLPLSLVPFLSLILLRTYARRRRVAGSLSAAEIPHHAEQTLVNYFYYIHGYSCTVTQFDPWPPGDPHPGSSPCLLLYPNPGRECWRFQLACWLLACSAGEVACLMYLPHTHHMWLAVNKQPTPTHAHTHAGRREVIAISTLATRICAKKCATRVFIYLMPTTDRRPPFNTTRAPQIAIMDSTYTQNGNKKAKRQRLYHIWFAFEIVFWVTRKSVDWWRGIYVKEVFVIPSIEIYRII